jgi:proteasome lid subunit RPN8/RPN11
MDDMSPVHRATELPVAPGRGQLLVAEHVLGDTVTALAASKGPDGPHEGLVLWAGRQMADLTVVTTTVVPETRHGLGHVFMDESQVGTAARLARSRRIGIVAQVHSHPGNDTRHSDGDDKLILMPYDGMFSLVLSRYGTAGFGGVGVHQYQDGRWCHIIDTTDVITIVPGMLP